MIARFPPLRRLWRRNFTIRKARLFTGIALFAYLTTHFLNHAPGLVSLDALEIGRQVFLAIWRNPIGTTLLYGSLIVHFFLALYAIYGGLIQVKYPGGRKVEIARPHASGDQSPQ